MVQTVIYGGILRRTTGVLVPLFFVLYINNLYSFIGYTNVRCYVDGSETIANNHDLALTQEHTRELFTKLYHWCIANKLSINSDKTSLHCSLWNKNILMHFICSTAEAVYSISQEICTRFCCALLCCCYVIIHNEFTWCIYPYSPSLLCWHWGNR